MIMIVKREKYLQNIRPFYDEDLIKVITGIRRSGKSVLLEQIIEEIKDKTDDEHIIYINFEDVEYEFIENYRDLNRCVKDKISDDKKYYLFFDEIQNVDKWEKVINSFKATMNVSIFITGSNSDLLSGELATHIAGRYVSFKVNPLTFKETVELTNTKPKDYKNLLLDIFEWGTLPQRFSFKENSAKLNYITDVYDSIILKDVVERLGIKDITAFNKIFQYVLEIEGKEFSANHVLKYLKNEYREISSRTLYEYLEALCGTFIVNKVYRYDIAGKSIMKTLNKFYASDLGVKKIKTNNKEINYSRCLENIIYNELIAKGYEVYIGKTSKGEIDFIATKDKEVKYIQVCYLLDKEETIQREFSAYNNINDNYPKYVISLDEENHSKNGIKHLNIFDFLMNDNF